MRNLVTLVFVCGLWAHPLLLVAQSELELGQEEVLQWGEIQSARGAQLYHEGRFDEALALEANLLGARLEVLGCCHPETARSRYSLGRLHLARGEYEEAKESFSTALDIITAIHGEMHANTAHVLNGLAVLHLAVGDYESAKALHSRSLAIRRRVFGDRHPATIEALQNLASVYAEKGEIVEAEIHFRKSLDLLRELVGGDDWRVATVLNNLAELCRSMGDFSCAERYFKESLEIRRRVLPDGHPDTAALLSNLAVAYEQMGMVGRAESYFAESLALMRRRPMNGHPQMASLLDNYGTFRCMQRDFAAASPLLRESLEIRGQVFGPTHPSVANGLNNLALCLFLAGDFAEAEALIDESLEIRRTVLGEAHPMTASSRLNLGSLHVWRGDDLRGEPLLRKGLRDLRKQLDLTSAAQSERQQLRAAAQWRLNLDVWLAVASRAGVPSSDQASELLARKGAVTAAQAGFRRELESVEATRSLHELASVNTLLATLAQRVPGAAALQGWRRRLEELTDQQERLERDLAYRSAEFRRRLAPVRAEDLRRALPVETALVDFFVYQHFDRPLEPEVSVPLRRINAQHRLIGFVHRPDRAVARVEFGPVAAIESALASWRHGYPHEPGVSLRGLLLTPLQHHLQGIETLLVSPDGPLSRLPWSALPGTAPDSYLLEELAVAVVPVPRLLSELLAIGSPTTRSSSIEAAPPLLLGDVNYDGRTGRPTEPAIARPAGRQDGQGSPHFPSLEYTRDEIEEISALYVERFPGTHPRLLTGETATEDAFRRTAPGHRWIHVATHGFFASDYVPSAPRPLHPAIADTSFERDGVVGLHPGLLSGLVLAGANAQPAPGGDDGILTALEVAALDLRGVEMAVLSACQSGLGATAAGEGVLGLQRAFQASGARTVVTALASVDDLATRLLMERFYRNLWLNELGRLEALREAQRWMLRQGAERLVELRRRESGLAAQRGTAPVFPELDSLSALPPYYWGGFVLSGDWR